MDFETRAIHAGQEPDPATGAVTVPIYQTSTYAQEAVGELRGYDYSRTAQPHPRRAGGVPGRRSRAPAHGLAFASGMAASTTVMHLVDPASGSWSVNDVYGGTYRLFSKVYEPKGYRFTYLSAEQCNTELAAHLGDDTALVWLETPTNPLLNVVDSARRRRRGARRRGASSWSTTPSPRRTCSGRSSTAPTSSSTRPPSTWAATPTSSAASRRPTTTDLAERLAFLQNSLGGVPGPFDCVARAARAEDARRAHARALRERRARWSSSCGGHERGRAGALPGPCPTTPATTSPRRQMDGFGGMVSFLAPSEDEAVALVARTRIWSLAESLGGVESLIEHPGRMTHASTADSPFATPADLVRLSVGIESAADLIADLDQALPARE